MKNKLAAKGKAKGKGKKDVHDVDDEKPKDGEPVGMVGLCISFDDSDSDGARARLLPRGRRLRRWERPGLLGNVNPGRRIRWRSYRVMDRSCRRLCDACRPGLHKRIGKRSAPPAIGT